MRLWKLDCGTPVLCVSAGHKKDLPVQVMLFTIESALLDMRSGMTAHVIPWAADAAAGSVRIQST